ncbi:hypothetical protein NSA50_18750 [Clostridium sp. DSM 100503]|uniref:hypothetical protein n=1 Tax=Clostridium sp. DSM 100503 TaxID=2963282 RepID=UPI00214A1B3C|nr:hypothetical protein [Clostridium sp. DSM 100503]MCR1953042.1 hypothetical protein [Clostridium sp. DSM 100503]
MPKVITYKKLKNVTETIMSYGDVLNIIEENLGSEVVIALLDFKEDELESPDDKMISYIEDGTFTEQIRESGLINKIVENILIDLEEHGYLKKSKNIHKFIPNEDELIELIDEKLSPGIMNYFENN